MNFDPTDDQKMLVDAFARFLDHHRDLARVRAVGASGFDRALWAGLAEMGVLALRVPEEAGGLGLGMFDAVLSMEQAGRTLASGPIAEAIVAARALAGFGDDTILPALLAGERIVTIALHDMAERPVQWIAGGAIADAILARRGDEVLLLRPGDAHAEANLAATPMAEIDLAAAPGSVLGAGATALAQFEAMVEEWKLLTAAALSGMAREALKLAAAYASERKQFGQPIGTFQGISHPLADCLAETDGGRFLIWKAVRDIADARAEAGAAISLALWWNADASARTVTQALHTFGGYGLTTEYDIHLYNLHAKALPLVLGDPQRLLAEAGRRFYGGETVALPDAGMVPIDFELGAEARAIASEVDAFFARHVTPEMRATFHYSWEGYHPAVHKKLAEEHLLFPGLPAELSGRTISGYAQIAARDAMEDNGYLTPAAGVAAMVALMIHKFGSDELKREVLDKVVRGEALCSLGYSEPQSGSDVFAAQCRATREGGGWRIDGTKMFTSGANLASYVLMLCRTNADVPKHKGLTMFVVPLRAEGVTIQPVHTFQDERTNITFYDDVRIPDSWRLGEVDGGVRTMSAALELEHGGGFDKVMSQMIAAAETLSREIDVDGARLIDQPWARETLARARANMWASRMLAFRAQWASIEGKAEVYYGPMTKLFSSEKFSDDARALLDLTAPLSLSKRPGPAGFLNQCYRHAHGTTIYGGTSEIHRSVIAERALGLPRTRA